MHRDLKPSNILFSHDGVAKVGDLGLAQVPGGLSRRSVLGSLANFHPGTSAYMSPEQEREKGYLLPTSDIFSLGCVLFEALTGIPYKSVYDSRTKDHRSDVPAWLDAVVRRMLAEQPGRVVEDDADVTKRYRTAGLAQSAIDQGWQAEEKGAAASLKREQHEKPAGARRQAEEAELARLFDEGLASLQREEWSRARTSLRDVVQRCPQGYERGDRKASDLLAQTEAALARRRRRTAIVISLAGAVLLIVLAGFLWKTSAAVPDCDKADVLLAGLDSAWAKEDWAYSVSILEGVATLCPTKPELSDKLHAAYYNYGQSLLGLKRYADARRQCEKALNVDPDSTLAKRCVEEANLALYPSSPTPTSVAPPPPTRTPTRLVPPRSTDTPTPVAPSTHTPTPVAQPTATHTPTPLPPPPTLVAKRIAFVSERDGNQEIYVMSEDGTGQRRLTNHPAADIWPSWQAEGDKIAFVSERDGGKQIYTIRADGTDLKRLTTRAADYAEPEWSADGKSLAFVSNRSGSYQIYMMDENGQGEAPLTSADGDAKWFRWSPTGKRIAFEVEKAGKRSIWLADPGSGPPRRITDPGVHSWNASLSPDGNWIAYVSDEEGDAEVYVQSLQDNRRLKLTNNEKWDQASLWSPAGSKVAFVSDRTGAWALYASDPFGEPAPQPLVANGATEDFNWRPDGAKIAFTSGSSGENAVYTVNLDGSGQTRLTYVGNNQGAVWEK
ncbi:MAG: PD40 domain-containing protein [Chloroflexi bacterium]|nr:PD40 domain-containing protein [Chloroflexota bacterium]